MTRGFGYNISNSMGVIKEFKWVWLILTLATFALQPIKTGFEKGHHGWVSADGLSLFSRADKEHYFVAVMAEFKTPEGIEYAYFDRYPPFFSPLMNLFLDPFEDDFNLFIMIARHLMNIIFLLTVIVGFRILTFFIDNKKRALGIALLVFSGSFFIHYKDMPHFDQPAILGNLLIILGICEYKFNNRWKFLLTLAIIVPLFGRGYSSNFLLLTWNIMEFILNWKNLGSNVFVKVINHIKKKCFWILVASVPMTAGFLGYNLYIESLVRNVDITETSIFDSAKRRLGAKKLVSEREKKAQWSRFIPKQIDRKKDLFSPELLSMFDIGRKKVSASWEYYLRRLPSELFGILVIILFLMSTRKYYKTLTHEKKTIYLTMIFSGFVWLYTMRKLATYHDYTTLYYVGLSMMLFTTLSEFKFKNWSTRRILILGCIMMFGSLIANLYKIKPIAAEVNHQADDFNQIREVATKELKNPIFYFQGTDPEGGTRFIYGSPFAPSLYTTGYLVTTYKELANVIIHWENGRIKIKEIIKENE